MDATMKKQILQQAGFYWEDGQPYPAGRVLFESIPVAGRPGWARQILALVAPYYPRDARVEAVLELACYPTPNGVNAAAQARSMIAALDPGCGGSLILRLAAQAGKIVYTAQGYPGPFEHCSGWKIAVVLWQICHRSCDNELAAQAWSRLANPDLIQLPEPVMCHPDCPVCLANGLMPVARLERVG